MMNKEPRVVLSNYIPPQLAYELPEKRGHVSRCRVLWISGHVKEHNHDDEQGAKGCPQQIYASQYRQ